MIQRCAVFIFILLLLLLSCQTVESDSLVETAVSTKTPFANSTAVPSETVPIRPPIVSPLDTPVAAQTSPAAPLIKSTIDPAQLGRGALVSVHIESQVGVLLDEFPPNMRDHVVSVLLTEGDAYWESLAQRQLNLTYHRLNFRNFIYEGKGQLPLPPPTLWHITLEETGPSRQTIEGHDVLVRAYQFDSTLLTNEASPGEAEPALADIGGVWEEPFILPVDPDLLVQRTGNACINEGAFPPNSFDSENASIFFDFACEPESTGPFGCHRTFTPEFTCLEAIDARIGRVETAVQFERLPWDEALANAVRTGPITVRDAPDMQVVADDLLNNRIIYRYFPSDACALEENAIGATGWRRLLQFDATLYNVGSEALEIGPVVAEDPLTNMFQYNACHDHFHFSHYGEFGFQAEGQATGSKQAFCVESTDRISNNEASPLTHPYSCTFQGIQAGWIDEYDAGLDVQWIDITDISLSGDTAVAELSFNANLDQFLCEGEWRLDSAGNRLYEPSGFRTENGLPISRPQCNFIEDWQMNNRGSQTIIIPSVGSFVTGPCTDTHPGPLRNCGFTEYNQLFSCTPGEQVEITAVLNADAPSQLVRVCEVSAQLNTGVACAFEDAIANSAVTSTTPQITFACPFVRDADVPSGGYAVYTAPLFIYDDSAIVNIKPSS